MPDTAVCTITPRLEWRGERQGDPRNWIACIPGTRIIESPRPAGYTVRPRATEPNQETGRKRAGEGTEGDGVNTAKSVHTRLSGKVTKQPNFHQKLSRRLLEFPWVLPEAVVSRDDKWETG